LKWTEAQLKEAVAPVRSGRKLTPKSWPEGARVAVCLSFDVDTETWGLPTGEIAPVPLSAGEYGATSGLPRILQLLDRHDLPASFYIPAVSLILHPEMLPTLMKSGRHEIALHGWVHENLPDLDDAAEEERLLNQAIDYLTKAVGKRPVGYRAPSWAFSKHTLDLIRKAGFLYDSSLMGMDQPYEIDSNGKPTGMVELPVEWILDDAPFFEGYAGTLPAPEQVFRIYKDEFDVAYSEGTMFMLTMHPRVIGHRSRMLHLEEFVKYMKSKPGVWFATGEQIARYLKDSSPRTQPSRE
jgi:peptidoglycan/xylan/chitin deacetylase (PgdA/CDA1 family)